MNSYEAQYISSNIDAIGVPFHLWHFTSDKTGRKYIVLVEQYQENVFAVKFYPRQFKGHPLRYSVLTGDNEPRTIIMSVIQIMLHYARKNVNSSFIIIGSPSVGENKANTKRFRFYQRIISEYFDNTVFTHVMVEEKSMYMMLRNTEIENGNISDADVIEFVDSNYSL